MTRKVKISNALSRHRTHKRTCVIAMINAVHNNIIDVEHQVAVRFLKHRQEKVPFIHRRVGRGVVGHIFEGNSLLEDVLNTAYTPGDVLDGIFGKRDWHQVVQVAVVTTIT